MDQNEKMGRGGKQEKCQWGHKNVWEAGQPDNLVFLSVRAFWLELSEFCLRHLLL